MLTRYLSHIGGTLFWLSLLMPVAHGQGVLGNPEAPLAAEILGVRVHTSEAEELRYYVLKRLTDAYAAERGIEVTAGEIEGYLESMSRARAAETEVTSARIDEVRLRLASTGLDESERVTFTRELEMLQQHLRNLEPQGEEATATDEIRQFRENVAAAFIRQWKINQAIYQEYGGRIIFQQGGAEPLDAYRQYLERQQSDGVLRILDPALEADFWKYFVTDSMHSFYPAGSAEEAEVFATPWWLKYSQQP